MSARESFLMSNMTPQTAELNRGLWKNLEEQVRKWAAKFGAVTVVTGPVLEKKASKYEAIGSNEVAVPEYFYKVLASSVIDEEGNPSIILAAFIMPNRGCTGDIWDYLVTVDEVEKRTGIDFFSALDDDIEERIESSIDTAHWK